MSLYIPKTTEEIREKLRQIRCFVLDMDGTIYLENDIFPFTLNFLRKARETGRDFCFFTNNSSANHGDYVKKLSRMGIDVSPEMIFISTHVIIRHIKENHPGMTCYVVGTPNLEKAFDDAGIPRDDKNPDAVILGFDKTLTYEKMAKACHFVRHGAVYYGVNPDWNCPMSGGEYIPDCGSMAKMVEASTGRWPEFFGKPTRHAFDYVMKETRCREEELCFVGDRIYTDIAIANGTKALSVMVLTGETKMEDLEKYDYCPDIILPSLASVTELI